MKQVTRELHCMGYTRLEVEFCTILAVHMDMLITASARWRWHWNEDRILLTKNACYCSSKRVQNRGFCCRYNSDGGS